MTGLIGDVRKHVANGSTGKNVIAIDCSDGVDENDDEYKQDGDDNRDHRRMETGKRIKW